MTSCMRTDAKQPDFQELVRHLDNYLAEKDGEEHHFYHQFNSIDTLQYVVLAYKKNQAVACGAMKTLDENTVEIKRMFTLPEYRGRGIAGSVLAALEQWAKEMNYQRCVLETGKRQVEAIALYHKNNYHSIPNYGQYIGVENSICFEKIL